MMWILLGQRSQEEDFGGFQLHRDIFLGVFDNYEDAVNAYNKATLEDYEDCVLHVPQINKYGRYDGS